MKKFKLFPLTLVFWGILVFTLVSCGGGDDDQQQTLTLNQAHTEFLSVLIISDTLSSASGTLAGLPHVDATIPCDGGGSQTIAVIDDTTDSLTFDNCQFDAVEPDFINGTLTRVSTDSDTNGVAENVMVTVSTDLEQGTDWDDDGVLDTDFIWSGGTTIEIRGFQNGDIQDQDGKSKADMIVNGNADATMLGNPSSLAFADFDAFNNLQDPGEGYILELAWYGTVEYSDDCIESTMELYTHKNVKLPFGPGFDQGTITINDIHSVLEILGINAWKLGVDDGTSKFYTQDEFEQFPATCP